MRKEKRPYVIMRMTMSVDARIAPGPDMTQFDPDPVRSLLPDESSLEKKISKTIKADWHQGGKLYGSWTFVRKNDPVIQLPAFTGNPQELYEDFLPEEIVSKTQHWSILIDGQGRYRTGYKGADTPGNHVLHVVSSSVPAEYLAFLRSERIPYLVGGQKHADLPDALAKLRSKLGLSAILLMGGGTLNGAMIRENLVDEIHLVVLPALFGGYRTPTLVDCDELTSETALPFLDLLSIETEQSGLLWLHYKVRSSGTNDDGQKTIA
jgi:2,5-diamino-6-(ribosylamino)-4(3H)-pyrimidinone 5'-phosphate reductase